jgi:hypothetical protein
MSSGPQVLRGGPMNYRTSVLTSEELNPELIAYGAF